MAGVLHLSCDLTVISLRQRKSKGKYGKTSICLLGGRKVNVYLSHVLYFSACLIPFI